jgi:hypothetical protein
MEYWSSCSGKASREIKGRVPCGGKLVRNEGDRQNLFLFWLLVRKHVKDKYLNAT